MPIEIPIQIQITSQPFDPWLTLQQFQNQQLPPGQYGATSIFIGTMRDFNEEQAITALWLEHYPGMTEQALQQLAQTASARWPLLAILIQHRVGAIVPTEPIVLVSTWAAHRSATFEATRYLMEALKQQAPFWKRETLATGAQRWVSQNTPGYHTS